MTNAIICSTVQAIMVIILVLWITIPMDNKINKLKKRIKALEDLNVKP